MKTILTLLIATIIASFCLTPGSQVEGQTLGRQVEGESIETRIGELSFTHDQPYSWS